MGKLNIELDQINAIGSAAFGGSTATGASSFAHGYKSQATGNYSFAMGAEVSGKPVIASGLYSVAMGAGTQATGGASTAFGAYSTAEGSNSLAAGHTCYAKGNSAIALGKETRAVANYQTAVGAYNADSSKALFIVGNGTKSTARSNAFEVISDTNGASIKVGSTTLTEAELADVKNAVTIEKGHSYTLTCQDGAYYGTPSSTGSKYAEINARFIAGDKIYNRMHVVEVTDEFGVSMDPSVYYDDEKAWSYYIWHLPNEVIFIDPLTDEDRAMLDWMMYYEGTDNGVVDIYMCGDKFLGLVDTGDAGAQWNRVECYEYYTGNINTPVYDIPIFDGISTEPGVYSIRLRSYNNIYANFTMVCNGEINANQSIYSTPCYCTCINKMVMLKMTHHQYSGEDYYEDCTLIHVIDMETKNDITAEVISSNAYNWVFEAPADPNAGGLEYTKLA